MTNPHPQRQSLAVIVPVALAISLVSLASCSGTESRRIHATVAVVPVDSVRTEWILSVGENIGLEEFNSLLDADGTAPCPTEPKMPGTWGTAIGGDVTIRDGSGKILATTTTSSPGTFINHHNGFLGCEVDFEVNLRDSDFYEITIGQSDPVTYSAEDLEKVRWSPTIAIGEAE